MTTSYTSPHVQKWQTSKESIDDAHPKDWDSVRETLDASPADCPSDSIQYVKEDMVNSPAHYTKGDIETIDYIIDVLGIKGAINYCHGNVIKYTGARLRNKGSSVENADKAIWYAKKMIELMKEDKI